VPIYISEPQNYLNILATFGRRRENFVWQVTFVRVEQNRNFISLRNW